METLVPDGCRRIDVLVYLREDSDPAPVGYEMTITVGGEGLEGCTMRPLTAPHHEWTVHPGSAIWSVVRSFLMVLPGLRHTMAMHPHPASPAQPARDVA